MRARQWVMLGSLTLSLIVIQPVVYAQSREGGGTMREIREDRQDLRHDRQDVQEDRRDMREDRHDRRDMRRDMGGRGHRGR